MSSGPRFVDVIPVGAEMLDAKIANHEAENVINQSINQNTFL